LFIEHFSKIYDDLPRTSLKLSVFKKGRPPVHCRLVDDAFLNYEYPHFEFEPLRRRNDVNISNTNIEEKLFSYYNGRTDSFRNSKELLSFYEEVGNRVEFEI
jgi:hypothetical protein